MYKTLVFIHVIFTIAALVSGSLAIIANPKGGKVHIQSGRYYFYSYVGVVLSSLLMLTIKFKIFFLALTLFGAYVILAGNHYAKQKGEVVAKNWWILSLLILTVFVYAVDVFFVLWNLEYIEYGWVIVRISFALIAFALLILELTMERKRILLHALLMLLSYIPLTNGLLVRISPNEYAWVFWILGYIVFLPIIYIWFKKSKKLRPLLNQS